jgi:mannose-6-phosphate isomerase-like protein (cupin superfamily)
MEWTFDMTRLAAEQEGSQEPWREFLRVPDLSAGLYHLKVGAADGQTPHGEDEVYYCLAGKARLRVGTQQLEVTPGRLLFVPAREEHRFEQITEDLTLLVIFGPAEGSRPAHDDVPA